MRVAKVLGNANRLDATVAKCGRHGQRLGFRGVANVADDDRCVEYFDVVAKIGLPRVDYQQVIVSCRSSNELSNAFVLERTDFRRLSLGGRE